MTAARPPRLVVVLLSRLRPDRQPLVGDLLEEFQNGRSRWWLWRQALAAAADDLVHPRAPLGLGLAPEPVPRRDTRLAPMQGIGIFGAPPVGGLGVLAISTLMTIVVPGVWWVLAATLAVNRPGFIGGLFPREDGADVHRNTIRPRVA